MCSKTTTSHFTPSDYSKLHALHEALQTCEAVVIGAGSGLSAAAGFTYDGARFRAHFSDFEARYGFHDMYRGGFYPFSSDEAAWAFWSRMVMVNRYDDSPSPLYTTLLQLLHEREYFVITTNVDHQFQRAGFDKMRLFYTQGDYGCFQCSVPCHQTVYDNEAAIRAMAAAEKDLLVPFELLPRCPKCGKLMMMHLRGDRRFVEDADWRAAHGRYQTFLRRYERAHVMYFELGIGENTPSIIKYPFWQMTRANPHAQYAAVNLEAPLYPPFIESQTIYLRHSAATVLPYLLSLSTDTAGI